MTTSTTTEVKPREQWTGQTGFILAAIGSAVGLGNIWRFPGVAYENGGGAFLIPYLVALITAGIPILFLDYAIGHRMRGAAPTAFRRVAKWMESLGVDFIVHHIGFDERGLIKGLSPLDELDDVVRAVSIPVQAVGGLSIEQAIECARRGAPLVVVGAPLVIDGAAFKPADRELFPVLQRICSEIKKVSGPVPARGFWRT